MFFGKVFSNHEFIVIKLVLIFQKKGGWFGIKALRFTLILAMEGGYLGNLKFPKPKFVEPFIMLSELICN